MSIGSFILIKNEAGWIGPHLACWLPYIDQMVFFDGNSTDGTLDIIRDFQQSHPHGKKITLVEGMDPKDLREDYVRLFNECMWTLKTDLAFFLHPDMLALNPGRAQHLKDAIAYSVRMESYAGEPDGTLYRIRGRDEAWQTIYRLRNPNLGAVYHGWYGAWNEGVYFNEIQGDDRTLYPSSDFHRYPYRIADSGLDLLHYSDVRSFERRYQRMRACLINQGHAPEKADELAKKHPRVTLKDGGGFAFDRAEYHPLFKTWKDTLSVRA